MLVSLNHYFLKKLEARPGLKHAKFFLPEFSILKTPKYRRRRKHPPTQAGNLCHYIFDMRESPVYNANWL